MFLIGVVCTVLKMHADYLPCELKYHSTNPTISYVLSDWCAISDTVSRAEALATPFMPAKAVELLANTTTCSSGASDRFLFPPPATVQSEFMTNVCAPQLKHPHDTRFNTIASKCLPPTIAPQHLQTCTDLLAEARLHMCSCGMGGDGCKFSQSNTRHFLPNCPIGMQDKGFWQTYVACKTVVGDWTARKLLYNTTHSPLEMLKIMTDCAEPLLEKYFNINYTEAYYTAENNRAYNHAAALRSLKIQCLLAPNYQLKYDNTALPKLIVQWNQQWCRNLF